MTSDGSPAAPSDSTDGRGRSVGESDRRGARVLVLGATGYVGGRLVPRLLEAGYRVRCLVRSPAKLADLGWRDQVDVVRGDLTTDEGLRDAFDDVDVVFHLVHSMGAGSGDSDKDFVDADRTIARHVARASARAHVGRIVYLGGLGDVDEASSAHLRSREEVAEVLRSSSVPATVLRAAVIIGSGSASFEMLRYLVERLPAMITPRWVDTRTQPIAIRDALRYLIGVIADPADRADHDYDIGGPDVLAYLEMMRVYAEVAGLRRRLVVRVPVLSPGLSSHWVNVVTPVPKGLARPLIQSLTMEVVVRHDADREDITDTVPGPCLSYREAVELALERTSEAQVETSWREAEVGGRSPAAPYPGDPDWTGGTLLCDEKGARSAASPEAVYRAVSRIGGAAGWPSMMWAWRLRGLADRLVGGVGLRRGRRDPERLRVGDALDFWRVEDARPGRLIRLRAEMRLPGKAWLEWTITPEDDGGTTLGQRALFAPRGVLGRLYWWALLPFHGPIFQAMASKLAREAEGLSSEGEDASPTATTPRTAAVE